MGKPESPHPGRRGVVVERVRLRWVKEVVKESWCELEEEEMSFSEKENEEKEEERKEEGKEEIEQKKKDSHSYHKFQ